MKKITIYTTNYCPYCVKAKELFSRKNLAFEEIDLSEDHERRSQLVRETGMRTVPQIFVGETFVGGCDDLHALEKNGELDRLLE
ncbi:MAG: glutaredoxin 3 [bacterium]|nr:glutaredoxin 3 [bacterium]